MTTSSNLTRYGGLAAVAAGALLLVADLRGLALEFLGGGAEKFSEVAATGSFMVNSVTYLTGAVLLLVALAGLYAHQSEAAGVLGVAGFFAALVGTGLLVGMMWTITFVAPSAAIEAPAFLDAEQVAGPLDMGFMLSGLAVAAGWALFGVATFRAAVFPRVAAVALIVGALLTFAPLPATTLLMDVAVAWLGVIALRETGRSPVAGMVGAGAQPRVR